MNIAKNCKLFIPEIYKVPERNLAGYSQLASRKNCLASRKNCLASHEN